MQLEIETLEKECDRIINEYLAQDIPINSHRHLFEKGYDFIDYQRKFTGKGGQQMIDYANMILAEYKEDDILTLEKRLTEVLQNKVREGLKKIHENKL